MLGTVSENDLDGIQQLKQLIDGSAVNFSNDGLVPNEIFQLSLEHALSFLSEKDAEIIPNVTCIPIVSTLIHFRQPCFSNC